LIKPRAKKPETGSNQSNYRNIIGRNSPVIAYKQTITGRRDPPTIATTT
jgi:hypothetical protein